MATTGTPVVSEPGTPMSDFGPEEPHPLQNTWHMWYDAAVKSKKTKKQEGDKWELNLKFVGEFSTVEDFWRVFNNIAPVMQLQDGANLHLFKKGIKPMWEDPINQHGGKWFLTIPSKSPSSNALWENLVYALVGEVMDADVCDDVCGAVFSRRQRGNRIAVWNRNKNNSDLIKRLGMKMSEHMQLPTLLRNELMDYSAHEDAMKTGASFSNPVRFALKNGEFVAPDSH